MTLNRRIARGITLALVILFLGCIASALSGCYNGPGNYGPTVPDTPDGGFPLMVTNRHVDVVEVRIVRGGRQTVALGRAMPGRTWMIVPRVELGAERLTFQVCLATCRGNTDRDQTRPLMRDRHYAELLVYPFSGAGHFAVRLFG